MSSKVQRWLLGQPVGGLVLAWFVLMTVGTALFLDYVVRTSR
jgi:hypothetical protein